MEASSSSSLGKRPHKEAATETQPPVKYLALSPGSRGSKDSEEAIQYEKASIQSEKTLIQAQIANLEEEEKALKANVEELKMLLRKGQIHWTEEEVNLYETPAGVRKEIDYLSKSVSDLRDTLKNTGQSLASLNQRLETQDQRLLALSRMHSVDPIWRGVPLDQSLTAADFEFSDRTDAFAIFAQSTEDRLHAWRLENKDRNRHPIPFLADGPGTGKSRFLDEVIVSFKAFVLERRDKYPFLAEILGQDPLFIRVTFGNGSSYVDPDVEIGIDRALARRILMPFLSNSVNYINSLSRNVSATEHALRLVSKNKSCVFLCIDEVNRVHDYNPGAPLKGLFNTIGDLSITLKPFLVPIVAGTVIGPIETVLSKSTHPPLHIPLRLLTFESSMKLVARKSEVPAISGRLRQLVADIGGHCRALEFLCRALAKVSDPNTDKDWAKIFEHTRRQIGIRYKLPNFPLSGALAYSFLSMDIGHRGTKVPGSNSVSFLDLEENGIVKLSGADPGPFMVQVPYIFVCIYLQAEHIEPIAKFWEELLMGDNFWWQDWEIFCRNYTAFRLSLYAYLRQKSVPLKSFFAGALFTLPSDVELIVPPFESIGIGKAENQFPTSSESVVEDNVCMLNAAGAPFDAFMFVQTVKHQRLLIIFQMKFSSLDTKGQDKIDKKVLELEYDKVKAAMDESLPKTTYVVVFLVHRDKARDFKKDQIPAGCILVTKDEEKELFGEMYYNRLSTM